VDLVNANGGKDRQTHLKFSFYFRIGYTHSGIRGIGEPDFSKPCDCGFIAAVPDRFLSGTVRRQRKKDGKKGLPFTGATGK
jgi:hypothetical protein